MAALLRVERRFNVLEARMTAVEQLPPRLDRLSTEVVELRNDVAQVRTEVGDLRTEMRAEFAAVRVEMAAGDERVMVRLTARIEDARRETRVLHEDVIGRIALLGEGLAATNHALAVFSSDTRAMFDALGSRLATIEDRLPVPRRRKPTRLKSNRDLVSDGIK